MIILAFGQIASVTGNQFEIQGKNMDTDSLQNDLQKKYPALAEMKYTLAVDKKIVNKNVSLNGNETVAILPPFSGG
jgi:sulfur-carrier protein